MHKTKGSIIYMIVTLLGVISVILAAQLRIISYYSNVAHEQKKYEQQYQLLRSLHNYGLCMYQENYVETTHSTQNILWKGKWPTSDSRYEGTLLITVEENAVPYMHTMITKDGTIITTMNSPLKSRNS